MSNTVKFLNGSQESPGEAVILKGGPFFCCPIPEKRRHHTYYPGTRNKITQKRDNVKDFLALRNATTQGDMESKHKLHLPVRP